MSFHPRPYPAPALEIQLRGSCEIEFRVNECTLTRPEHAYANIRLLRSSTFWDIDTAIQLSIFLQLIVSFKRIQRKDQELIYFIKCKIMLMTVVWSIKKSCQMEFNICFLSLVCIFLRFYRKMKKHSPSFSTEFKILQIRKKCTGKE